MSVKIRLKRVGAKKRPMYRIVVADSQSPRDGKSIEVIGHFNPMVNPPELTVKQDRVEVWIKQGAIPTPTAKGLILRARGESAKEA
jgi:small subunit ribosomal protein S16